MTAGIRLLASPPAVEASSGAGRLKPMEGLSPMASMTSSFVENYHSFDSCELLTQLGSAAGSVGVTLSGPKRNMLPLFLALAELADDWRALVGDTLEGLACLMARAPSQLRLICGFVDAKCFVERFQHRPLYESLIIMVVGVMMSTLYFAVFLSCMRHPIVRRSSWPGLLLFHECFVLAVISYLQGITTDPGGVPESWLRSPETEQYIAHLIQERKRSGELRFCHKELKYKPDRAHFCSVMQRNVLRMDHYCPWMNNCIGHFNYKFFLLFLLYTVVATNIACFGILHALWDHDYAAGATVISLGGAGFAGLLAAILSPFLCFHLWLLSRNITTIEFCEKLSSGQSTSPYDLGVWRNCQSVLGDRLLLWFLPVHSTPGDGITWPRAMPCA